MRVCGNPRATFAALLAGLALGTVPAAHALTFTVNSQADAPAGGVLTNGVCETAAGNGVCTLRAALQKANAVPGVSVTIVLPAGTYGRIGDYPTITVPLTIQGAGVARTIIDAAYAPPSNQPDQPEGFIFQANGASVSGITIRARAALASKTTGRSPSKTARSPTASSAGSLIAAP